MVSRFSNFFFKFKIYAQDSDKLYQFLDNWNPNFKGFHFNILKDDNRLIRAMTFPFLIAPVILWFAIAIVMNVFTPYNGFDASLSQLSYPLTTLLVGEGWDRAVFNFFDQYGKGCHWSAAIIYYYFFVSLSRHFRKLGIVNSLNVVFTSCFTALTIAAFEYYWQISYYFLQNQPWILSFMPPQTMISIQNLVFATLGFMRIGNINWKVLKPNFDKQTWIYLSTTIFLMILWWNYGLIFPTQQISIQTDMGVWTSSKLFPQTVYTVNRTPSNLNLADSEQYWICNDYLHLVNLLAKIFLTLTMLNIFKLKERERGFKLKGKN